MANVADANLEQLRTNGYTIVEGFLAPDELAAAQEALWLHYPRPKDYFADPTAYPEFTGSQFAGLREGPWQSWDLNRLAFHPDLVDLAERFLESTDLRLYKTELWAKYAGAVDYDQKHHRDYGNHSLVPPKRSIGSRQMTSFILLSDVSDKDGPTKVVPFATGQAAPFWPVMQGDGAFADEEVAVTGPAGTLFTYRTDILHRGSAMHGRKRSRFALLADYEVWGTRWTGKVAWPNRALNPHFIEMIERAAPRERALFGFPAPGDPYWDGQTLADTKARYPNLDITPYRL